MDRLTIVLAEQEGLLREVLASELPRSDQSKRGYGRLLRDDLVERIREHLRGSPLKSFIASAGIDGALKRLADTTPEDGGTK